MGRKDGDTELQGGDFDICAGLIFPSTIFAAIDG
jgi:hypothetical protein